MDTIQFENRKQRMRQRIALILTLLLPLVMTAQTAERENDESKGVEYMGGYLGLQKEIEDNLKLSPEPIAITDRKVMVRFMVTPAGTTTDFKVVKHLTHWTDDEALRVAKKLTKWKPALDRDAKPQPAYHLLQFEFGEEDDISILAAPTDDKQYAEQAAEQSIWEYENAIPQFVGGAEALSDFVLQNLTYPAATDQHNITGTVAVFIQLNIDKAGNVSDVKIQKGVSDHHDAEAIRIAQMMPKWIPAQTREGVVVDSQYNMPIVFRQKK